MRSLICLALLVFAPISLFAASVVPDTVLSLINSERTARGLPEFREHAGLANAALIKVEEIRGLGELSHTRAKPGASWWTLESAGYRYVSAGENLALTFEDSVAVVLDWMQSPAHRDNMMNPQFTDAGVAVLPAVVDGAEASFVVLYMAEPDLSVSPAADLAIMEDLLRQIADLLRQIARLS